MLLKLASTKSTILVHTNDIIDLPSDWTIKSNKLIIFKFCYLTLLCHIIEGNVEQHDLSNL